MNTLRLFLPHKYLSLNENPETSTVTDRKWPQEKSAFSSQRTRNRWSQGRNSLIIPACSWGWTLRKGPLPSPTAMGTAVADPGGRAVFYPSHCGNREMTLTTWVRWASLMAQMIKNLPATQKTKVRSLGQEDTLEKEMATHSSILPWRTPWAEEPGGLQPIGLRKSWT